MNGTLTGLSWGNALLHARTIAADSAQHSVGEPVREVCTDQRCSKSSPGVSDTLGMQFLLLECG
jgi:hypothetical protein